MLMPTISQLRNATGLLAIDALTSMRKRLREFVAMNPIFNDWEAALRAFLMPVGYEDFLVYSGKRVWCDEREYEIIEPISYEYERGVKRKKGSPPKYAHATALARFGGWGGPQDPMYPIDADIQIWFKGRPIEPTYAYENERHIKFSYNQLSGRCLTGRMIHWCESPSGYIPGNTFLASLNKTCWGMADPLYRKTPDGEAKVDEILRPGMLIRITNDSCDREYIIEKVTGPYVYRPIERPEDHVFETYSLVMINPETMRGGYFFNELVAVGGKVHKLFMSNDAEVVILGSGFNSVAVAESDEEDLDEEECAYCAVPQAVQSTKRIQLSLF